MPLSRLVDSNARQSHESCSKGLMIIWRASSPASEPEQAVTKECRKGGRGHAVFDASVRVQGGWARHAVKALSGSNHGIGPWGKTEAVKNDPVSKPKEKWCRQKGAGRFINAINNCEAGWRTLLKH